MKQKNPNQIIRLDGKNVFLEVMSHAFEIGKVNINFIEYDVNQEKNSRIKQSIPIYIDMDKMLVLINDILSGRMSALAKAEKAKGNKWANAIYADLGGVSARNLEARGKSRPDGMSLSRQFKITPGDKMPWILSGEMGAGKENDKGLIVPQGKAENLVRVPLSDDDFKRLAIVVKAHIESFITSQYLLKATNPQEENSQSA